MLVKMKNIKKILSITTSILVIALCATGLYLKTNDISNKEELEKYIKQISKREEKIEKENIDGDLEGVLEQGEAEISPLQVEIPNPDNYETYWDYKKAIAEYETAFLQDKTVPEWAFKAYENYTDVFPKSNEIKVGERFDSKMKLSKFMLNSIKIYDNISELNISNDDVLYSYQDTFSKMVKGNGDVVDLDGEDMAFAMVNMTVDCYSKWPIEIDFGGWPREVEDMGEYYCGKDIINGEFFKRNGFLASNRFLYLDKHQDDISEYFCMLLKGGESVTINLGLFVNKNNLDKSIVAYDDSFYGFSYFSKGQFFFKLKQ